MTLSPESTIKPKCAADESNGAENIKVPAEIDRNGTDSDDKNSDQTDHGWKFDDRNDNEMAAPEDPYNPMINAAPESVVRKTLKDIGLNLEVRVSVLEVLAINMKAYRADEEQAMRKLGEQQTRSLKCSGCGDSYKGTENFIGACSFYSYHPNYLDPDNPLASELLAARPPTRPYLMEIVCYGCCHRPSGSPPCSAYCHIAGEQGIPFKTHKVSE